MSSTSNKTRGPSTAGSSTGKTPTAGVFMGMGNPLLDISAEVKQEMLTKYGVTLNNAILAEEKHQPIYKDLVDNHNVTYIAGGATQNSVRVAQWMFTDDVGATSYVGCIGKDDFGAQMRKIAEGDKVAVHYLEDEKTPTGTCAVLVVDKERSLIANLAAANNYKFDHLKTPETTAVMEAAQVYYSAGFFATVSEESILHVAKHSFENKKTFTMNLSAPFICQFFGGVLDKAFPYTDIIFGNESEAEAWGKAKKLEDCSPKAVALALAALPSEIKDKPRMAVITQGDKPTIVAVSGVATEYAVPPVENIVDVNGAGDAFVGGFLARYITGSDVANCVEGGHFAAATILKVSGTVLPK